MRQVFAQIWDKLSTSFWFVPFLLAILAAILSFVMVAVDEAYGQQAPTGLFFIYASGPDGARAVLTTVASSMIGVGGTVFSITMAVLSLASNTFGSRLLRSFMRDRANQTVLGVFVATFLYCLLVMRTVRSADEDPFVPYLSVAIGVLLAVISLAALIFFIHHISQSIQAERVTTAVAHDLDAAIDDFFPESVGEDMFPDEATLSALDAEFARDGKAIVGETSGYIQIIRTDDLLELLTKENMVMRLNAHPGNFYIAGTPLAHVIPGSRLNARLAQRFSRMFILGPERTAPQDVEYALNQLVEIAVRALSSGINDPFTAMACIDRLAAAVSRLATRPTPSPYRKDRKGELRMITRVVTFQDVVDQSFDQIRQNSGQSMAVTIRLLEGMAAILSQLRRDEYRMAVLRQAQAVWRGIDLASVDEIDLADLQDRLQAIVEAASGVGKDELEPVWEQIEERKREAD